MRTLYCIFLFSMCFLFCYACKTTQAPYDYAAEPDPTKKGFVLGPSDEVRIDVWRNPDLSRNAIVRPDGTITIPLIGDIKATGLTPDQLKKIIEKKLEAYIKDQAITVTISVTAVNSYRFTVTGDVANPGIYSATRYVTVQEAIAMAGGPTRFATGEETVIVRRNDNGATRRIPVDYKSIIAGQKSEQNLSLLPGDVVLVK